MPNPLDHLPEHLFNNPPWSALHTAHQGFALTTGQACRYPAEVAPFAAVAENTPAAWQDLHSLLTPGETVYVPADLPLPPTTLRWEAEVPCFQMAFPPSATLPQQSHSSPIVPLSCADAHALVALTDIAYPGFFRQRTCEMGPYYGIFAGHQLIAMGGERIAIDGEHHRYREISGLCTHPAYRGQGHARTLITHLLHSHRRADIISYLHVVTTNANAIALYLDMGFVKVREIMLQRITRPAD